MFAHQSKATRGIIPALAGNTPLDLGHYLLPPDHPRSRGEYPASARMVISASRIIPALAGNTSPQQCVSVTSADHPRSRGEYRGGDAGVVVDPGSSPLSRGIPSRILQHDRHLGIIPALAGNTCPTLLLLAPPRDHPRSRGEYFDGSTGLAGCKGSSPLSRGILLAMFPLLPVSGIIPALAGNTGQLAVLVTGHRDHPRSRGEYLSQPLVSTSIQGSSPLSRGIPRRGEPGVAVVGIIPALAGNTPARRRTTRRGGDHPRSRGEYRRIERAWICPDGSSPLSRGILHHRVPWGCSGGIIPALAGNTTDASRRPWARPDHPRSRGEYCIVHLDTLARTGSSPLSRGILDPTPGTTPATGIIPALAGNTPAWFVRGLFPGDHPRSRGEYVR